MGKRHCSCVLEWLSSLRERVMLVSLCNGVSSMEYLDGLLIGCETFPW